MHVSTTYNLNCERGIHFYSTSLHPGSILVTSHNHKNTNVITLTKDNDITCISELLNPFNFRVHK